MKRIFDFILALIGLVFLSPIFLFLLVIVYLDTGGPIFKQKRIGKEEKVFNLYKLKSMKNIDEKKGLVSNANRVTKLGRFIRNTSLDELPSLLNILKGDMSFVGPRPLLVEYLPYYKEKHKVRHDVRPGLTGLAQINGRNQTTWQKRLDFDIEYVNKRNLLLDLKIFVLTFWKVIKKEGVESSVDLSIVRLDQDVEYQKNN